jgi:hypothetical protein
MREPIYDVVVVGGGGAGLAAAIEARKVGREVLLLEKNPALGGSTAWSIGSITSSATPHQIKRGIKDCPADHWADMPAFAGDLASRDNDELRRILCDEVPHAFRWLMECGVRFYGPVAEPPHHKPRMHTVLPNSGSYIYHLERHARRLGVKISDILCAEWATPSFMDTDAARAESDLAAGKCDLIAVGRPFLANPDLVARWKTGAAVNAPDFNTFYTPGAKGYTDYPALG